jgi:hypothetical protein
MTGKVELGTNATRVVLSKVRSDSVFKAKLLAGANEAVPTRQSVWSPISALPGAI